MSKEITLWIDERWYNALSDSLKGKTLEEHLENIINEMCRQLPQNEYEHISMLIQQEDQQRRQEREAARRFAVFYVKEHGEGTYFLEERPLEFLQAASVLRDHLRRGGAGQERRFVDCFPKRVEITGDQFTQYVYERLENTGRVTGAYDIDLDDGEFSAVNIDQGWQTFQAKDVSAAAYHAMRKTNTSWDERWRIFLDRLDGRQLTRDSGPSRPSDRRPLCEKDISFADEISEMDGRLNFYMETWFDVDKVFGTHVCTGENDDTLNVYANYDMAAGEVCDELEIDLHKADGHEETMGYRLNVAEKKLLLRKMEEYCQQQTGLTLKEYSVQLMKETHEQSPQMII